ncbi:MAG: ribonuclease J [Candidatus Pacebacteria bacterium]|jgi:ribonuclease J|nr:ribonuclease J [Candidatus Paceibacterota bacterium]MBT4652418.1 ribonuclease J [Candidatus Paceibacterota bacterium]MBT6756245.1 ribonuclease J [Candidatus Paceibacterota bacterium]MBT6921536.1 ribonuclease J [Candidatus Paceibacterota bacterium]
MSELRIVPLGGLGKVTQNMYLYEYGNEILIVDCGIGFPDEYMPGVDTLIPDTTYLHEQIAQGKKVVGMVISHGHEDHMGALPYILPEFEKMPVIWGSTLTIGFVKKKIQEKKLAVELNVFKDLEPVKFGEHFSVMSLAVTHSVPDTKHLVIETPEGTVYHGSDFKLDDNPIDGVKTDLETMKRVGNKGIVLALLDCLRVEQLEPTGSESLTGPELEKQMINTKGKYVITLMSSHIHRIQQVVDAAEKLNRRVAFIGRSVEQNVTIALELKKLKIPNGVMIDKRDIEQYRDRELCIVIAGSQGQEGSSLTRAVFGEHRQIRIFPNDKVVFSAGAIPGSEIPYYRVVNELAGNDVTVVYPDVVPDLHKSGHASAAEQREVVKLLHPKYVMPIGGEDRHRSKFREYVSQSLGYKKGFTLIPKHEEVLGISNGEIKVVDSITIKPRTVDGLGIGDVGPSVLSDRRSLSQAGMVVLVLPRINGRLDLSKMDVISKGFVFVQESNEVIDFVKQETVAIFEKASKKIKKEEDILGILEKKLSRKLFKVIRREPMIIPVILDV